MTTEKSLYLGRTAFEKEEWKDALSHLSTADSAQPLHPHDLELSAIAAYLTGNLGGCHETWTRAHNAFLKRDDIPGAARCAFWMGFTLMNKGEAARGGSWIRHAQKLLEDKQAKCVEQGYVSLPLALACLGKGDIQGAIQAFNQSLETAEHFGDDNLRTLASMGHGQALIRSGDSEKGIAFLDEAMVTVESGGLSPIVAGIVYCAVIEACLEMFDFNRAGEWTNALSAWCSAHPNLVPFRGQCFTRRSEILGLHGEWTNAIKEAHQAIDLLSKPTAEPAAGAAFYQLAELYRLQGEYSKAEEAYSEANKLGRKPQPGLALLRLAQGQVERARSSINNALMETKKLKNKCDTLFAGIQIALTDEDSEKARSMLGELKEIANRHPARFLEGLAAQAEGAVLLAEGDPTSALAKLLRARTLWEDLKVPYEAARARSVMAIAYRKTGDEDSANMEYEAARWGFQQLKAAPDIATLDATFNRTASRAHAGLTQREDQVLHLIADGKSNKSIADELFISERTVERHVSNIFRKLDVSSRTQATAQSFKLKRF